MTKTTVCSQAQLHTFVCKMWLKMTMIHVLNGGKKDSCSRITGSGVKCNFNTPKPREGTWSCQRGVSGVPFWGCHATLQQFLQCMIVCMHCNFINGQWYFILHIIVTDSYQISSGPAGFSLWLHGSGSIYQWASFISNLLPPWGEQKNHLPPMSGRSLLS